MGRKPRSTRRVGALCCFVVIALAGTLFSLGYAISSRREFRESTAALADAVGHSAVLPLFSTRV